MDTVWALQKGFRVATCDGGAECCQLRRSEALQNEKEVVWHKSQSQKVCVCATGQGRGTPELNPLDERLAAIIGESLLSGEAMEVEVEVEVDTGMQEAQGHYLTDGSAQWTCDNTIWNYLYLPEWGIEKQNLFKSRLSDCSPYYLWEYIS